MFQSFNVSRSLYSFVIIIFGVCVQWILHSLDNELCRQTIACSSLVMPILLFFVYCIFDEVCA